MKSDHGCVQVFPIPVGIQILDDPRCVKENAASVLNMIMYLAAKLKYLNIFLC